MNLNAPHVLAGDTNVSIDLAQGSEWVLDAVSTIRRRLPDSSILVPPPFPRSSNLCHWAELLDQPELATPL